MTTGEIEERWRNHARANYDRIWSVMKGATLANSAYVLTQPGLTQNWTRWPFWIVSFLALTVTYYGYSVGSILTPLDIRLRDAVLPLMLGVAEFVMFSALIARPAASSGPPRAWYFAFAVFGALASSVIWSVRARALSQGFDDDLKTLVDNHRQSLRNSGIGSAVTAISAMVLASLGVCGTVA